MDQFNEPVVDEYGRIMFHCSVCKHPLTRDDFFELSMRLPDYGETRDDYLDHELLDTVEHLHCLRSIRAG